ncbi:hypothetical protein QE152_g22623 [Popillia japonica]|uniref:HTH psq-type domain-containing protein n=1 Tax=Popillia japonica TaxID=7064 RepID=A0AAW1KJI0_POPJA
MDKRKIRKYTSENMAAALAAATAGLPVATASKTIGIPRITLRNKVKGISPEICNMGPSTILSFEEELRIVTWLVDIAKAGFPVTKQSLINIVAKFIKDLDRKTPFCDGIPGKKCFKAFLKRHPNISLKTCQKLTGYRGKLTENDIHNTFAETYFRSANVEAVAVDRSSNNTDLDESTSSSEENRNDDEMFDWVRKSETPSEFSQMSYERRFGVIRHAIFDTLQPLSIFRNALSPIYLQYLVDQSNLYGSQMGQNLNLTVLVGIINNP